MRIVMKSLGRKAVAAMSPSSSYFLFLLLWMVLFGVCGVYSSYQWDGYRIWDK